MPDRAKVLEEIQRECSIVPFYLEINVRGEVVIKVPPSIKAMPLSPEQLSCVKKLVGERMKLRMAS